MFDRDFVVEIFRCSIVDVSFFASIKDEIKPSYLEEDEAVIMGILVEFYKKYNNTPSKAEVKQILTDEDEVDDIDDYYDYLDEIYETPRSSIDFVRDTIIDFLIHRKILQAHQKSLDLMQKNDLSGIYKQYKDIMVWEENFTSEKRVTSLQDRSTLIDVIKSTDKKESDSYVPTGFYSLDALYNGGPERGTLNMIVTPPSGGKTSSLVNIAKGGLMAGFKVAFFTLELKHIVILRRLLMSILNRSKQEIRESKNNTYCEAKKILNTLEEDSLRVEYHPAKSFSVDDLDFTLDRWRTTNGFTPDLVIVDYADTMKAYKHTSHLELRHQLAEIYYGLRNTGVNNNSVVWTASQTNREGHKENTAANLIDQGHLGEAFNKAAIVDSMWSINQTLEEKRNGVGRMYSAKNRDDESSLIVDLKIDWTRCYMEDV